MMSEVFGWFGDAARGLLSVFPQRRIIRAGHAGIRYGPRGGIDVLPPGWYFFFPLFQDFEEFPIAWQTVDVAKQPLITKDGKTVTAGGAMRFRVDDVKLFCVDNYNTFEDIDDVGQVALRDVVISHTLEALQSDRDLIDRELRIRAQRRVRSYGVRVREFNLKGLAPAQLIHVVSDSQAPVLIQNNQGIQ